jgi:hypothetical protein
MDYICDDVSEKCYGINNNLEKYFYDHCHQSVEGSVFFGQRVDQIGWLEALNQKQSTNVSGLSYKSNQAEVW